MYSGQAMKSMSPHERAAVYKNQLVGATWLLLWVGVMTLAGPFIQFTATPDVDPGLIAPVALGRALNLPAASPLTVVFAGLGGGLMLLLGWRLGLGHARAALIGALVIGIDWPLVLLDGRAGDFPELLTSVLRLFYLFFLLRAFQAARLREELLETMRQADREYDMQLAARAGQRGTRNGKKIDSRFEPEDDYQG